VCPHHNCTYRLHRNQGTGSASEACHHGWATLTKQQTSKILTLPLARKCTPPNLVPQHLKLPLCQRLRQNVRNLRILRNILKDHCSLLTFVSKEMVLDINVLGEIAKHWILRKPEAPPTVTIKFKQLCPSCIRAHALQPSNESVEDQP
jgi:hypothetical protein